MNATLYTDGGSRGNPGIAGIGFALVDQEENSIEGGAFIGTETNNVAEYKALIWGLDNALAHGVTTLEVKADSELMIKQLKGEYKVKSETLKPLYSQVRELLSSFESVALVHVLREFNETADKLANIAMDERAYVGNYLVEPAPTDLFSSPEHKEITLSEDNNNTGIYRMTCKAHFDAAHALIGYPGECKNLHGHTWDIEATVVGTVLDDVGILYDFKALKSDINEIIEPLDHAYLNDVPPFDKMNATAENLARYLYKELSKRISNDVSVDEVVVWESPIAKITYREE